MYEIESRSNIYSNFQLNFSLFLDLVNRHIDKSVDYFEATLCNFWLLKKDVRVQLDAKECTRNISPLLTKEIYSCIFFIMVSKLLVRQNFPSKFFPTYHLFMNNLLQLFWQPRKFRSRNHNSFLQCHWLVQFCYGFLSSFVFIEHWSIRSTIKVPDNEFIWCIDCVSCLPSLVELIRLFPIKHLIEITIVASIWYEMSMAKDEVCRIGNLTFKRPRKLV